MQRVKELFEDIDRSWRWPASEPLELPLIGSAALMVLAGYERGTKDTDVLETLDVGAAKERLLELAGKGTEIATRRLMYIDIVSNGLPFLPHGPLFHLCDEINAGLQHLRLKALDVVDVVVSKLKRFSANDRNDIRAMVVADRVPHARLVDRFRSAVDEFECAARFEELPKCLASLHQVERDYLGVTPSDIELPEWH